ncbi:hypothetical protein COBT_001443 [Conglomerata obtusa]
MIFFTYIVSIKLVTSYGTIDCYSQKHKNRNNISLPNLTILNHITCRKTDSSILHAKGSVKSIVEVYEAMKHAKENQDSKKHQNIRNVELKHDYAQVQQFPEVVFIQDTNSSLDNVSGIGIIQDLNKGNSTETINPDRNFNAKTKEIISVIVKEKTLPTIQRVDLPQSNIEKLWIIENPSETNKDR